MSAPVTQEPVFNAGDRKVARSHFPAVGKEDPPTGGAPLRPDPVEDLHRDLELEGGVRFPVAPGQVLVVEGGDELHDLDRACPDLEETLEEEVVEDEPGEVGPLDKVLDLGLLGIEFLELTSTEGAAPFHELFQVDLLPASGTGGVGGMHSRCHGIILGMVFERKGALFNVLW